MGLCIFANKLKLMYPYLRATYHLFKAKRRPKFEHPFKESQVNMRVFPWDIDMFMELNNGRYLTLMDIGRFDVGYRVDLFKVLKQHNWGLMVGAVSSRYRRRLKPFQKFTLHTQLECFDERWFYFRQWFTSNKKVHASFLVRTAVVSKNGLVPVKDVINAMPFSEEVLNQHNKKSDWIKAWEVSDDIHKEIMKG